MRSKLSVSARRELLLRFAPEYIISSRLEKGRILDEFVASTGYTRKRAITLLNDPPADNACLQLRRKGPKSYDAEVQNALIVVWRAANCICSKRLVPFLPEFVGAMQRFGHLTISDNIRDRLLAMSSSTVDRLLCKERRANGVGISTTRAGSLLRSQIPIRTFTDWNDLTPGFVEADLVAHCGYNTEGSYLNTLTITDIATGWTLCIALLNKSRDDVISALTLARKSLPFPLLGLDTDNGAEFINHELVGYCKHENITFTRSRPYKKNDQAHVEQKNGSIVRQMVGYERYEGVTAWKALTDLYTAMNLYINFFQPSLKLISKVRVSSHVSKVYDAAKTPCQRLLENEARNADTAELLRNLFLKLDPIDLVQRIKALQDRLWPLAIPSKTTASNTMPDTPVPARIEDETVEIATDPALSNQASGHQRSMRAKRDRAKNAPQADNRLFMAEWDQIHIMLTNQPDKTARKLLEELQVMYPGRFASNQVRTLKKRVRAWRQQYRCAPSDITTRSDERLFMAEWDQIHIMLTNQPDKTARRLLEELQELYPGKFTSNQICTLKNRVREWRQKYRYSLPSPQDAPNVGGLTERLDAENAKDE